MTELLVPVPAREAPELLATPVRAALAALGSAGEDVLVAAIDPELADTAAFCAHYGVRLDESANCVVVATRRAGETQLVGCVVLAITRVDVNGALRRHVGARKASFAPMPEAVAASGMEFGGITPVGLPGDWPLLIDAAVARHPRVVVGSGLRRSKLILPGRLLAALPGAQVLEGLGRPAA